MPGSIFKFPQIKLGFENAHPGVSNSRIKSVKKHIWEQLSDFKSQRSATLMIFDINGKMDLEKLI